MPLWTAPPVSLNQFAPLMSVHARLDVYPICSNLHLQCIRVHEDIGLRSLQMIKIAPTKTPRIITAHFIILRKANPIKAVSPIVIRDGFTESITIL